MQGFIPCSKSFSTILGSPKSHPSGSNARRFHNWMALTWTRCHLCLLRKSSKLEMIIISVERVTVKIKAEDQQPSDDLGNLKIES
jgi:hypothetical protein